MVSLFPGRSVETYIHAADGNLDNTFDLYAWNIRIAAALQGAMLMVEVAARNAIDSALTAWMNVNRHGDCFDLGMMDEHAKADTTTERARVHRNGGTAYHDRVLSELSFGFWRFLTTQR